SDCPAGWPWNRWPDGRGMPGQMRADWVAGWRGIRTTCHGADPLKAGKTLTFRKIEPLAPSAAPARFTDTKKVEKWFRRNCNDVFGRECSAQEKGDFISWISNLK
ncbi:DUF1924 domain-containing protein, partial [Pseudomonas aeruginosa]